MPRELSDYEITENVFKKVMTDFPGNDAILIAFNQAEKDGQIKFGPELPDHDHNIIRVIKKWYRIDEF